MKEALLQAFSLAGLLWLSISVIGYIIALWVNKRCKGHPLAHPIVVTALIVSVGLYLTNTGVTEYQQAASLLHWLLGPITVALALPIYRQWQKLKHKGYQHFRKAPEQTQVFSCLGPEATVYNAIP